MRGKVKAAVRDAYFSPALNGLAVRAYSLWRPPPYRRPDMEFLHNAWTGISTFHSEDGRQIGENNAAPQVYHETIGTEHSACRFADSRFGLPINTTALRRVLGAWDDVLQLTMLLRRDYLRRRGLPCDAMLNLRQAYGLSRRAASCAAYVARRRDAPARALPRLETAFYTMGVAPYLVAHLLIETGDVSLLDDAPMAAEAVYRMADRSGGLISPVSGKGCAGSPRLIVQFLDVLLHGAYGKPLTSADAARAIEHIGDLDRFDTYVEATARTELMIKLQQMLCVHWLRPLLEAAQGMAPPCRKMLQDAIGAAFHRRAAPVDDATVLRQGVRGLLGLLEELGSPVAGSLLAAGLVDADHAPAALSACGEAGCDAADRIRQSAALLHAQAQHEISRLHGALGRFAQGHPIGIDDFLVRCAGPALPALLLQLEAAAGAYRPERLPEER